MSDEQLTEVFVVTFDPLYHGGVGGFDWFSTYDEANAQYEKYIEQNKTSPPECHVRLWNAFPSTTDRDAITEYLEAAFVEDDPEGAPIRDSHPHSSPRYRAAETAYRQAASTFTRELRVEIDRLIRDAYPDAATVGTSYYLPDFDTGMIASVGDVVDSTGEVLNEAEDQTLDDRVAGLLAWLYELEHEEPGDDIAYDLNPEEQP